MLYECHKTILKLAIKITLKSKIRKSIKEYFLENLKIKIL